MGVAALSTSAIALAPAPAPAPQASGEATGTFAKLVTQAGPDGKTPGEASPETDGEAKGEEAIALEESAVVTTKDSDPQRVVDQSGDLLAKIQAMAVAASQMFVSQPTSVPMPIITATPDASTPTPIVESAQPGKAAKAAPVALTPPSAAARPAASAVPIIPLADGQPAPSIGADLPDESAEASGKAPAKAPPGNDIASLIAALKAKLGEPADNPRPEGSPTRQASDRTASPSSNVQPLPAFAQAAQSADPALRPHMSPASRTPATSQTETASTLDTIIDGSMGLPAAAETVIAEAAAPVVTKRGTATATLPADQPTPGNTTADAAAPATDVADKSAAEVNVDQADMPAPTEASAVAEAAPATIVIAPQPTVDPATGRTSAVSDTNSIPANRLDDTLTRQIDVERDAQWLDRLARDISQAAGQQGPLKFQLNPHNLGTLAVEIANDAAGTAIRFTAETDEARAIIADAQPRLIAEVRAQGLRVAETHVELNQQQQNNAGSNNGNNNSGNASNPGAGGNGLAQGQGQNRQASEDHKPFSRTHAVIRDESVEPASRDEGEMYA